MKIRNLVLFLFIILSVFTFASAQDTTTVIYSSGDWDYIDNTSGGITLAAYHGNDTDLVIPESIDEKAVTALQNDLFTNKRELVSVYIPDSVKSIGRSAFFGCASLKEVRLPSGLTRIQPYTFRYCISIEQIEIPFSVTNIGEFAFADCLSLKEIMLISVTTLGTSAFDNCPKLSEIVLSNKISSIGANVFRDTIWLESRTDDFVMVGKGILIRYKGSETDVQVPYGTIKIVDAFSGRYEIESVTIPETVTEIGTNAFLNAINLKTVILSPYISSIGASAFNGCRSLETIELPESLVTLGSSAFANCNSLKSSAIPAGVTNIPNSLFENCRHLTNVVLPAGIQKFGSKSFSNAPDVQLSVVYGSTSETYAVENSLPYNYILQEEDGIVYSRDAEGVHIVRYRGNLLSVEIPGQIDGAPVVSIETGAFQNDDRIRSVIIPLTVKSVGDWVFSEMDGLQTVHIPDSVETLGSNLFVGSPNLREIIIPASVQTIGETPFDAETKATICAAENSEAANLLSEWGFAVQNEDACPKNEELISYLTELSALGVGSDYCDCPDETGSVKRTEKIDIIRIPDGTETVNSELLGFTAEPLILVIPSDTAEIDPAILDYHTIYSIVSGANTAAEAFAAEHDLRFFTEFTYYMNSGN